MAEPVLPAADTAEGEVPHTVVEVAESQVPEQVPEIPESQVPESQVPVEEMMTQAAEVPAASLHLVKLFWMKHSWPWRLKLWQLKAPPPVRR